jgi:hypothetical protein
LHSPQPIKQEVVVEVDLDQVPLAKMVVPVVAVED